MTLPRVTIGIPFYNEEKFLAATIESALRQTYKNMEVIIADNCSEDSSFSIASRYAQEDSRVRLYRHETNRGPSYNFEFVLQMAASEYFVWLGGHDVFGLTYIEKAVEILESNKSCVMAYPDASYIDAAGNLLEGIEHNYSTVNLTTSQAIVKLASNFHNGYVIHGVFRTEVLKKIPVEKVIAPDLMIILRANFYGRTAHIPDIGFYRRMVRKETSVEQSERHVAQGIYKQSALKPFGFFLMKLYAHIVKTPAIALKDKYVLMADLRKIFRRRFKVTWKNLFQSALQLIKE